MLQGEQLVSVRREQVIRIEQSNTCKADGFRFLSFSLSFSQSEQLYHDTAAHARSGGAA